MTLPPLLSELIPTDRVSPLGPGSPNVADLPKLQALRIETAFAPHAMRDRDMAACCLAGLWLLHDYLDTSHALSQEIRTVEGSYWHALMHRREPDFANSKYWFRRVGTHPVYEALHHEGKRFEGFPLQSPRWDPFAFVDLCEASYDERAETHSLCLRIQQREWHLLFQHCFRLAIQPQN